MRKNKNTPKPATESTGQKSNKKVLTMFLILFPSLLLTADFGGVLRNLGIKLALIFYQYVLLSNFLKDYYKLLE